MTPPRKVKVLLVDDHALVREGIRSSLVHYEGIMVIGEAGGGREAVRKSRKLCPDVVLMDLNMPDMGGLEAIPLVRKICPKTKIIALTVHDSKEYLFRVLRLGAHGYVTKDTSPGELVQAITTVARGAAYFSPSISRILLQDVQSPKRPAASEEGPVSGREKEVLKLIADGLTSKEVASRLNLSTRTVETYRVRLKRKLKARNLAELLNRARESGLL